MSSGWDAIFTNFGELYAPLLRLSCHDAQPSTSDLASVCSAFCRVVVFTLVEGG